MFIEFETVFRDEYGGPSDFEEREGFWVGEFGVGEKNEKINNIKKIKNSYYLPCSKDMLQFIQIKKLLPLASKLHV